MPITSAHWRQRSVAVVAVAGVALSIVVASVPGVAVAAGQCSDTCMMTYQGGPLEPSSKDVVVRWDSRVPAATVSETEGELDALNGSSYLSSLSEYDVPAYSLSSSVTDLGTRTTSATTQATPFTVDDSQVQSQLSTDITSGRLPPASATTNYFVLFPPGATVSLDGSDSLVNFCAYNSTFSMPDSAPVQYTVLPDFNQSGAVPGCGSSASNALTLAVSNYLVNMTTDPQIGINQIGWYDSHNGEVGLPCYDEPLVSVSGYAVSRWWSNSANDCIGGGESVAFTRHPGSLSGATAQFTFADTDPYGTTPSFTCRLDNADPTACSPATQLTYSHLAAGHHVLTVTGADGAHTLGPASYSWSVDNKSPTLHVREPAQRVATTSAATFAYSATDPNGVASYDARTQARTWSGKVSAWRAPRGWTATTALHQSIQLHPGNDYCVEVRATDKVGNTSAWSAPQCVASPVDDASLHSVGGGWSRLRGAKRLYYRGTIAKASRHNATLRLGKVGPARIALVLTRCAGCGVVSVDRNGSRWRTVNTSAHHTEHKVIVILPVTFKRATLTLQVVSSGKPVYVDGVAVLG